MPKFKKKNPRKAELLLLHFTNFIPYLKNEYNYCQKTLIYSQKCNHKNLWDYHK